MILNTVMVLEIESQSSSIPGKCPNTELNPRLIIIFIKINTNMQ
jgi:hypothetical protein